MADPLHLRTQALAKPDAPAVILGDGTRLTFRALDNGSIALAHELRRRGLQKGDAIALLMENRLEYLLAVWAAMRAGLYVVPVNWHLKADEVRYIVSDSGARVVVTSGMHAEVAGSTGVAQVSVDDPAAWAPVAEAIRANAALTPASEEAEGQIMYYSSGTTGRPKGIRRPIQERAFGVPSPIDLFLNGYYKLDHRTTYLCPAPLYHAAPLNWSMTILRYGGTIVVMKQFDALEALRLIEAHRVTAAQFVPTMFVRMLQLPDELRDRYSRASLALAAHAGAPCAPDLKRRMLDWWGPIIHEYYGGSEGNGVTAITPQEWLARPGSVGRAVLGELHVCDEEGREVPRGETGTVYFGGLPPFEYHGDPEKTRGAYNPHGWSTLGDIGHVDADGYLFLTDRKAFMIISGGVNIYPLEIENVLASHPAVQDVAVIGAPHPELGEEVLAVVEPRDGTTASPALGDELIAFCRSQIAHFKCPRRVIFDPALPRLPNGKLLKRLVKARHVG